MIGCTGAFAHPNSQKMPATAVYLYGYISSRLIKRGNNSILVRGVVNSQRKKRAHISIQVDPWKQFLHNFSFTSFSHPLCGRICLWRQCIHVELDRWIFLEDGWAWKAFSYKQTWTVRQFVKYPEKWRVQDFFFSCTVHTYWPRKIGGSALKSKLKDEWVLKYFCNISSMKRSGSNSSALAARERIYILEIKKGRIRVVVEDFAERVMGSQCQLCMWFAIAENVRSTNI